MKSYLFLVYGEGGDYIVVDGVWSGEGVARARVEFLNTLKDDHCNRYLCLNWTYEEVPLNQTNVFRKPDPEKSGWILR